MAAIHKLQALVSKTSNLSTTALTCQIYQDLRIIR